MMDFEEKAYRDTAAWLLTPPAKKVVTNSPPWRDHEQKSELVYADALKAELARVKKHVPTAQQEQAFKDFLLGNSKFNNIRLKLRAKKLTKDPGDAEPMLPAHKDITGLY